ncbi:YihY/virulence factor BrkB family protein [Asticcacaulis sp.]|uniref:YihY/virulence factor BrkB family protein n=1 Tax=Asticcacaulis sp. TaxID=1872648 RepID=UPI003F7BF42E
MTLKLGTLVDIIRKTVKDWQDDDAPRYGAALAFYSVLSLGPLLLVVISLAGLVLGQEAASGLVLREMRGMVGDTGALAIQDVIRNTQNDEKSLIATLVGTSALLLSVSGFFAQLQGALNHIFNVPKAKTSLISFVMKRVLSFSMIICICLLLLLSLAVSSVLSAVTEPWQGTAPVMIVTSVNFVLSVLVATVLFALTFKILPDVKFAWRNVWMGAFITGILFTVGKSLIGIYLGHSSLGSTYGAAGSLIVLLVWIYYSTQIIFFGAEFTQVYGRHNGETFETSPSRSLQFHQADAPLPHRHSLAETLTGLGIFSVLALLHMRQQRRSKPGMNP